MDPMGSISGLQFMMDYSTSITKKAMDSQEAMAQAILDMLPQQPAPRMGQFIDVYA